MIFANFIEKTVAIQQQVLSPEKSHSKMEPQERVLFMKNIDFATLMPKNAAVMALVYPKNNIAHLSLILRTSYNGVHSSQIAFPGGKAELFDADFWATALRETEEEIGILTTDIHYLKDLTPLYVPPSNFMVYPFLGYCKKSLAFRPDPTEVAGIIEISLHEFLHNVPTISKSLTTSYMTDQAVNGFEIDNYFVWGATAMILSELKDLLIKSL